MSVEQTSQLIQLILNSALMVIASVIALTVLVMRHTAITDRLHRVRQDYAELLNDAAKPRSDRLLLLKRQLWQLRRRYRTTYCSLLGMHYALLLFVASTLILSLRATLNANWLISVSLVVFAMGLGILLLSVSLVLFDCYAGDRSLWQDLHGVFPHRRTLRLGKPAQDKHRQAIARRGFIKPRIPLSHPASVGKRLRSQRTG